MTAPVLDFEVFSADGTHEGTVTAKRVPYYRAVGSTIEKMDPGSVAERVVYEPWAVVDSDEIAVAVAETMDKADLARDRRKHREEAGLFHLATNAPGFRYVS